MSEVVKALKQRIDELERENKEYEIVNEKLRSENDSLTERVLDLEACK